MAMAGALALPGALRGAMALAGALALAGAMTGAMTGALAMGMRAKHERNGRSRRYSLFWRWPRC